MAESFDPYYKWLGIPPAEQPANRYRLLGLPVFESDMDVIENAVDQRMAHVRTFQSGKHGALSQKLLNELSAARVCLLNPETKAAYDSQLKAQLDAATVSLDPADELRVAPIIESPSSILASRSSIARKTPPPKAVGHQQPGVETAQPGAKRRVSRRQKWILPAAIAGGSALVLIVVIVLVASGLFSQSKFSQSDEQTAEKENPPVQPEDAKKEAKKDEKKETTDGSSNGAEANSFAPPSADELSPYGVKIHAKGYVSLPAMLGLGGEFTVELWQRLEQFDRPKGICGAAGKRPGSSQSSGWQLFILPSGENVKLSLQYQAEGANAVRAQTDLKPDELQQWNHLAVCRNANGMQVFVNGQQRITCSLTETPDADQIPYRIGIADDPRQRAQFRDNSGACELRGLRVSSNARYGVPFTPALQLEADDTTIALHDFSKPQAYRLPDLLRKHDATLVGARWVSSDGMDVKLAGQLPPVEVGMSWKSTNAGFGSLLKTETGWQHQGSGAAREFVEVDHTSDHVELAGTHTSERLRIQDDQLLQWYPPELSWRNLVPGRWESSEVPVASVTPETTPTTPPEVPAIPEAPLVEEKLGVPGEAQQATARSEIRSIFASQFEKAKNDKEANVSLAKELLAVADDDDVKPASQFVLLSEAQELAVDGGEIDLAFEIAARVAGTFEVDAPATFAKLIERARTNSGPTAQRESLIKHILNTLDWFVVEGRFDLAEDTVKTASSLSSRLSIDKDLRIATRAKLKEIADLKRYWDKAEDGKSKLKQNPDDAEAHLAVGTYESLIRGNWQEGLEHLSTCSDASLKAAAEMDLAEPDDANAQVEVGNAWWDLAQDQDSRIKDLMRLRARHWYEQALPDASAIAKLRLKERLELTEEIAATYAKEADRSKLFQPGTAAGSTGLHGFIGRVMNSNQTLPVLAQYQSGGVLSRQPISNWLSSHKASIYSTYSINLQGTLPLSKATEVSIRHGISSSSTSSKAQILIDGQVVSQVGGGQPNEAQLKHKLAKGNHAVAWQLEGSMTFGICDFLDEDGNRLDVGHDKRLLQQAGAGALQERLSLGHAGDMKATAQLIALFLQAGGRVTISEYSSNGMQQRTIQNVNQITSPYFLIETMYFSSSSNPLVSDQSLMLFKGSPPIHNLSLRGTRITDAGLAYLSGLTTLHTLNLENSPGVTGEGLKHLSGLTNLSSLILDGTSVTDKGMQYFKQFPQLRSVRVKRTAITDKGVAALADIPAVREVYLGSPALGDAAFKALAGITQLETLNVSNTMLSDQAFQSISQCETLKRLHLEQVRVSAKSFEHLTKLRLLDYLHLNAVVGVTDVSFEQIAKIPTLANLYVYYIPTVNDAAISKLQNAKQLRYLYFSNTSISEAGVRALKELLPATRMNLNGKSY